MATVKGGHDDVAQIIVDTRLRTALYLTVEVYRDRNQALDRALLRVIADSNMLQREGHSTALHLAT